MIHEIYNQTKKFGFSENNSFVTFLECNVNRNILKYF